MLDLFQQLADRTLEVVRTGAMSGDVRRTSADTSAIRSQCSWRPRVSLRDGLHAQLQWYAGLRAEYDAAARIG